MWQTLSAILLCVAVATAAPKPAETDEKDICSLPPVEAGAPPCEGQISKFTFNPETKSCEPYIYGGCGGTANLFDSDYACVAKCNRQALLRARGGPLPAIQPRQTDGSSQVEQAERPAACSLPPIFPGPIACSGAFPKWTFDPKSGKCESYVYGGCRGTENLFDSEYACIAKCDRQALLRARARGGPLPAIQPPQTDDSSLTVQTEKPEVCSLPPIFPGPIACSGAFPKWTFNSKSGKCESYVYGGCRGTENLFDSEYACIAKCDRQALLRARGGPLPAVQPPVAAAAEGQIRQKEEDTCSLPPITAGPIACTAAISKWTFNSQSGACEPYIYGGCGGTSNLFNSEYDCIAKCNRKALLRGPAAGVTDAAASDDVCLLPRVEGPCKAHVDRYYFDQETQTCTLFRYSGCRANGNNFETVEECRTTCRKHMSDAVQTPVTLPATIKSEAPKGTNKNVCTLPPVESKTLSCFGYFPKWTFNATAGKCQQYVYGGCGKTANLFNTEKECQATCGKDSDHERQLRRNACLLPPDHGPCFGWTKRFAFNKEKNRCEVFTYGGCRGNANNFKTAEVCLETCGGDAPCSDGQCESVDCDMRLYRHYIENGCRPSYKPGACCPSSFDCPLDGDAPVAPVEPQCFYRGVAYKVGEPVTLLMEDQPCRKLCTCQKTGDQVTDTEIICAEISCAPPPPDKHNCVPLFTPGECCPLSFMCDGDTLEPTCTFNNQDYVKGQTITTGNPCKACTCVDNFNGLNGPGCRDIYCTIKHEPGCVPVYADGVCCPITYRCVNDEPAGIRIIREGQNATSGLTNRPELIPGGREKWQVKAAFCLLPSDSGPCRMSQDKFYYDADQQKCLPFLYGGCKGNENKFDTIEECLNACTVKGAPQGSAPIREGPFISVGGASTLPAAVSREDGQQRLKPQSPFIVTPGGAATLPAALSRDDDDDVQQVRKPSSPFIVTGGGAATLPAPIPGGQNAWQVKDARCLEPQRKGRCKAHIESFYFDSEKNKCLPFVYGGCGGNHNRFESEEECMQICKGGSEEPTARSASPSIASPAIAKLDACDLPQKSGPCRASIPSYSYNQLTKDCDFFTYSGCLGNGNRFSSREECLARCTKKDESTVQPRSFDSAPAERPALCSLNADKGPCRAHKNRYFYNNTAGECQDFKYGGCRGNANNFESIDDCESKCMSGTSTAINLRGAATDNEISESVKRSKCKLPADPGFCRAQQERFYYDHSEKTCKTFSYGGCLGNANNFPTQEVCMASCAKDHRVGPAGARGAVGAQGIAKLHKPGNVCTFGNLTLELGDRLALEHPCEECVCSTPPELTCTRQVCPFPDFSDQMVCKEVQEPGQCCPSYSCVSANPPYIDVCEGVNCKEGEYCEVKPQESEDGSWAPPIGVCVDGLAI